MAQAIELLHADPNINEPYDQQRLSEHLQMYFIETPKLKDEAQISPNLRGWLKFLSVSDETDLEVIKKGNRQKNVEYPEFHPIFC